MLLLKMAFRNLWRRKFRTIITMIAIGFSMGLMIFFVQLTNGSHEQMTNTGIRMNSGHVVVQGKGYNVDKELEKRVLDPQYVEKVIRNLSSSSHIAYRIFTSGSLRSSDGSVLIDSLLGVEHNRERAVSDFPRKINKGAFLSGKSGEIVIGEIAAKLLKVEIDSKLQLSVSDLDGNIERVSLRVKGIFKTGGNTVDRGYAMVNLDQLQKLLKMGTSVSQVTVYGNLDESISLASRVKQNLDNSKYEVLNWEESLPSLYQLLLVDSASAYIFIIIILSIVAAGILNSVLMSVLERTREFGVLKSIGMKPGSIFKLIMTEAFLLGVLSVIAGLIIGLTVSGIFYKYGLDPADFAGSEQGMEAAGVPITEKLYPKITLISCIWTSFSVVLLTIVSAIPPSIRAARIIPVKAIKG